MPDTTSEDTKQVTKLNNPSPQAQQKSNYNPNFPEVTDPEELQKHLKILGLTENATQKDVKIAFKELALQYHTDKSSDKDETKMQQLNEARQALLKNWTPPQETNEEYKARMQDTLQNINEETSYLPETKKPSGIIQSLADSINQAKEKLTYTLGEMLFNIITKIPSGTAEAFNNLEKYKNQVIEKLTGKNTLKSDLKTRNQGSMDLGENTKGNGAESKRSSRASDVSLSELGNVGKQPTPTGKEVKPMQSK